MVCKSVGCNMSAGQTILSFHASPSLFFQTGTPIDQVNLSYPTLLTETLVTSVGRSIAELGEPSLLSSLFLSLFRMECSWSKSKQRGGCYPTYGNRYPGPIRLMHREHCPNLNRTETGTARQGRRCRNKSTEGHESSPGRTSAESDQ